LEIKEKRGAPQTLKSPDAPGNTQKGNANNRLEWGVWGGKAFTGGEGGTFSLLEKIEGFHRKLRE